MSLTVKEGGGGEDAGKIARKRETLSNNKVCSLLYCFIPNIIHSAFMAFSTVLTSKDRYKLL